MLKRERDMPVPREKDKSIRLTRSDIIALLKHHLHKPPPAAKYVVVEVEQGDKLINVNDVDALVVSWVL